MKDKGREDKMRPSTPLVLPQKIGPLPLFSLPQPQGPSHAAIFVASASRKKLFEEKERAKEKRKEKGQKGEEEKEKEKEKEKKEKERERKKNERREKKEKEKHKHEKVSSFSFWPI